MVNHRVEPIAELAAATYLDVIAMEDASKATQSVNSIVSIINIIPLLIR